MYFSFVNSIISDGERYLKDIVYGVLISYGFGIKSIKKLIYILRASRMIMGIKIINVPKIEMNEVIREVFRSKWEITKTTTPKATPNA